MDKRLIDADKLLDRLEREKFYWFGREGKYGDGHYDAYENLVKNIESGAFNPDPIPLPTIKPEETQYVCSECKEISSSVEWNNATLKVYGSDIYLIDDEDKDTSAFFVCPKCGGNVDFNCLEVSHD